MIVPYLKSCGIIFILWFWLSFCWPTPIKYVRLSNLLLADVTFKIKHELMYGCFETIGSILYPKTSRTKRQKLLTYGKTTWWNHQDLKWFHTFCPYLKKKKKTTHDLQLLFYQFRFFPPPSSHLIFLLCSPSSLLSFTSQFCSHLYLCWMWSSVCKPFCWKGWLAMWLILAGRLPA